MRASGTRNRGRWPTLAARGCVALCCAALAAPLWAAKLYRWVDQEGRIHYSDTVPPDQVPYGREELDQRGLTVRSIERAKTAEELEEERRLRAERAEQERQARQQSAYDRMLLDTYSSIDAMAAARDGRISGIRSQIGVTEGNLENLGKQLDDLMGRAAALERSGQTVPPALRGDIAATQSQIDRGREFIAEREAEERAVRAQFDKDMARYREVRAEIEAERAGSGANPTTRQ